MSDFLERFKNRKTLQATVEVPVGPVTFTIARFAWAEHEAAIRKARKLLREEGLEPDKSTDDQKTGSYCEALGDYIKRHIKGWKIEGEDIPFDKTNLDAMFDEMSATNKLVLGLGYLAACEKDSAKKNDNLQVNGVNSSADGLSTSLNSQA